jgi:DNA-binding transcriptional LysR family regulator
MSPSDQRRGLARRVAVAHTTLGIKLIQSNVGVIQWSDWFAAFPDRRAPDRFTVRFDRAQMSLDAATQGLGVALESATIAGRHIAERKLRPVFGLDKAIKVKAYFAVCRARHAKRRPVEAFLAWLHGEASKTQALGPANESVCTAAPCDRELRLWVET